MDTIDFLKTTGLFNQLENQELTAIVSHIKTKKAAKNNSVIMAGDTSSTLYIIT